MSPLYLKFVFCIYFIFSFTTIVSVHWRLKMCFLQSNAEPWSLCLHIFQQQTLSINDKWHLFMSMHTNTVHTSAFTRTHMHIKHNSTRFRTKLCWPRADASPRNHSLHPLTSKLPLMSLSGAKMASINQGARCNLQCPECKGRGCEA